MTTTEITTPAPKNISRRKMLKSVAVATSSVLLSSPAIASIATEKYEADTSLDTLNALIDAHGDAMEVDCAKWKRVGEIEVTQEFQAMPARRVQVGRLLQGRDAEGNDIFDPIYASSPERIERAYQGNFDASLMLYGTSEARKEGIRTKFLTKIEAKKTELAAINAEVDQIERLLGYSQALEEAEHSMALVKEIEQRILSLIPPTLAAAARQASWISAAYEDDSYITREGLLAALQAIGGAVTAATINEPEVPERDKSSHKTSVRADFTGRDDDLSFVTQRPSGGGFDYWNVQSNGNRDDDYALGSALAEEFLTYIGKHHTNGNATLLPCIVESMIARRREPLTSWGKHMTGIESGFLRGVSNHAMAMACMLHDPAAVEKALAQL